jgi:hypothetical protein
MMFEVQESQCCYVLVNLANCEASHKSYTQYRRQAEHCRRFGRRLVEDRQALIPRRHRVTTCALSRSARRPASHRCRRARPSLHYITLKNNQTITDCSDDASRNQLRRRRAQWRPSSGDTHLKSVFRATWVGRFPRALDFVHSETHHSI